MTGRKILFFSGIGALCAWTLVPIYLIFLGALGGPDLFGERLDLSAQRLLVRHELAVGLIECDHLDDAIEVAARHPFAAHGVVEVRPVWDE